jgi:hypothetical protein
MSTLRLSLLVVLFAACGGGASTAPVDHATAEQYCQEDCDHQASCDGMIDAATCTSECMSVVEGIFREDVLADVTECSTALACGADQYACFEDNCTPTSTHEAYESRCREVLAGCDVSAADIEGECETTAMPRIGVGTVCAVAPEVLDEMIACFDEDCEAIAACEQAVVDAHRADP